MATAAALRSLSSSSVRRLLSLFRASYHTSTASHGGSSLFSSFFSNTVSHRRLSGQSAAIASNFKRFFSADIMQLPPVSDPDVASALKDLMAMNWDEIPESVAENVKKALSKSTDDKAGQEALAKVFSSAVASVEFGGTLVSLRMALDDLCGLTGENVDQLPQDIENAMKAAYKRYTTYLDSFGPDEWFLRKKVESELGTKMIHLKMRCSGIGSEWGKVTLIGTSGLSGSYVEQRA